MDNHKWVKFNSSITRSSTHLKLQLSAIYLAIYLAEAQEVDVVKYWLNAKRILAPRAVWLLRHLPRLWDVCGSSHRLVWDFFLHSAEF